jgi:osmotically-inducible protein OsmY
VKLALLFHRHVSATQTGVSVKNGTVTLTGEASSRAQKDLTTTYAKRIESAYIVTNEMTIQ